jgi:acetyl-CoA carboxylase biotin carboxylase subunit
MFRKILIANRGEIAVRIIKACKEMGIKTVAVYSEVDRNSKHVQLAEEAFCIGAAPALESYLNINKIIEVARSSKAEAIHPGYGFLAENHLFAKRCEQEGIIFIGPNSKALELVGDKLESRKMAAKGNIPIIPGMESKELDISKFAIWAEKIGYPVILKASAGGGGKGMRIINNQSELETAIEAGMREAKSAFGDETVYLEKLIEQPRHVEFQVLADNYGNAVHLFERECSIQRRHQKIVEETPSPALNQDLRNKMGEAAIKVIKLAGYNNAGTVEFLLDKTGNFYFLEVNARIQVEHPITEMVTGVDLVKAQIRIASGEKLWLNQNELKQRGAAIECRIYAEDPDNNFFPSIGKILYVQEPSGPGIRVDSSLYSGLEISVYYDPILSKLIAWAEDRISAIDKMIEALSNYIIIGVKTQINFLKAIMQHPEYRAGNTHTNFIPMHMQNWKKSTTENYKQQALIAAAICSLHQKKIKTTYKKQIVYDPWLNIGAWEIGK